ncbi:hypothetical protein [Sporomusa acidovorans]|uniref:hypothetical protein n=1 Tax=Sporomusa acidovorans TaxID=112900 RepID=UPI00146C0029|nr:hypothetical protein [Sporomusa acidovorans]
MREIELYTKDQLIFYYDAAKEQEIERRTDFIYAVRAAVYLDGSTLNRMMEEQTKK